MRRRFEVLLAAVLLLGVSPPRAGALPPAPTSAVSVAVAAHGGDVLVSVVARTAALSAVLSEVGRQAGIEIVMLGPAEPSISVEFPFLRVDRALERLLAGGSFALVYDGTSTGRPRRIIVAASGPPRLAGTVGTSAVEPPEADDAPRIVPEDTGILDAGASVEHFLAQAAHPDRRLRTAALQGLTLHEEDDRARRALMDHVTDADPYVRTVAIVTLGRFLAEWPGAEDHLVTALQDPVARVRALALHTLVQASSPRAPEAVTRALDDADAVVRSFAAEAARGDLADR